MKQIVVTSKKYGSKVILLDDEDFERVSKIKWGLICNNGKFYPHNNKIRWLHKFILGPYNGVCDHIDGNPFNNQKSNLRICTQHQNMMNRSIQKNNKRGLKGFYLVKRISKFRVQISVNDKTKHIGYYWTELEAAKAYNEAVKLHYGEFAKLNPI